MLASTWDWPVVPWHRQNFDQYPNGYGSKGVPTDPWNRSSWPILSMTPSNFGLNSGRTIAILICGYSQSLDPSWSVLWGSIFLHKLENPIHVLFSINVSVYTHPIPSHPIPIHIWMPCPPASAAPLVAADDELLRLPRAAALLAVLQPEGERWPCLEGTTSSVRKKMFQVFLLHGRIE